MTDTLVTITPVSRDALAKMEAAGDIVSDDIAQKLLELALKYKMYRESYESIANSTTNICNMNKFYNIRDISPMFNMYAILATGPVTVANLSTFHKVINCTDVELYKYMSQYNDVVKYCKSDECMANIDMLMLRFHQILQIYADLRKLPISCALKCTAPQAHAVAELPTINLFLMRDAHFIDWCQLTSQCSTGFLELECDDEVRELMRIHSTTTA